MPDAFQDLHAELALLREQVESQLAAHRAEVAAALRQVSGERVPAASASDLVAIRPQMQEWAWPDADPEQRIASATAEYQALSARAELERHRQRLAMADLEKQLSL